MLPLVYKLILGIFLTIFFVLFILMLGMMLLDLSKDCIQEFLDVKTQWEKFKEK